MPQTPHIVALLGAYQTVHEQVAPWIAGLKGKKYTLNGPPLPRRGTVGHQYLEAAWNSVADALDKEKEAYLSIWTYDRNLPAVRAELFPAGLIVSIPETLYQNPSQTKSYMGESLRVVDGWCHQLKRLIGTKAPFTLPIKAYESDVLAELLKEMWDFSCAESEWKQGNEETTKARMKSIRKRFHARHPKRIWPPSSCTYDNKNRAFVEAEVRHERISRNKNGNIGFIKGRQRFGIPIPAGFHYHIYPGQGKDIKGMVAGMEGGEEWLRDGVKYINVYTNDFCAPGRR